MSVRGPRAWAVLVAAVATCSPAVASAQVSDAGLFLQLGAGFGASWLWHQDDGSETLASPGMGFVLGSALTDQVRVGLDFASWSSPIGEPSVRSYNLGVRVERVTWKERGFVGLTAGASEYSGDLPYHSGGFVGVVTGWRIPLDVQAYLSLEASARAQLFGDAVATNALLSLMLYVVDRP